MAPHQSASPANVSHLLAAALRKKSAAVKKRRSPDFRKKALLEATVRRVIEDIRAEQIAIREQKYEAEESEDFQLTKDSDFQLTKDNPPCTDSALAPVKSRWDDDDEEEEEEEDHEMESQDSCDIKRDLNKNEVTTDAQVVTITHTSLSSAIDAVEMERRPGTWKPNTKGDWRYRVEDCESDSEEDILGLGSFFSRVRKYTHKRG
ncbi:uncharacterized protein [Branchiostoma lanceolatum]|uniref:uncharacterized protein n=1 Tax=Branchiostoma lanceolatum TaxID=7740 RepID=UPI00345699D3